MAEQVSKLDIGYRDDVSAGASAAAAAIRKVGDAATYTEERVTRVQKSGAALANQYGEQERLTTKVAAIQAKYARDLEDVERSGLDAAKAEELRNAILAQQTIAIQRAETANQQYIAGVRAMNAGINDNIVGVAAMTATYKQTMAALDPAALAMQQYAGALEMVKSYHASVGSSADVLATDLNKLASAYDPVTIATNKRTQEIYAEMDALQQSIALAKEETRVRQNQEAASRQVGVRDPTGGEIIDDDWVANTKSARDSAGVFAEEFAAQDKLQRELEETAEREQKLAATRQQLRAQFDPLYAAQVRYEKQMEQISKALEMQAIDERLAAKARTEAEASFKQQTAEVARGAAGMGRFSQAVGQGGMQLQDMAVQLQMNTNGFIVLGQQLPQFLGIFGPGGAVAGAGVALVAMAGYMLTAGSAAEKMTGETSALADVMKTLTKNIDDQHKEVADLAAAYENATEARRGLMRVDLQQRLTEEAKAIAAQEKALKEAMRSADFKIGRGDNTGLSVGSQGGMGADVQKLRQLRDLMNSGDYTGFVSIVQSGGAATSDLAGEALTAAKALMNLKDSTAQAKEFLNLIEQGLTKSVAATKSATSAANEYTDVLSGLAGESAWIEAAAQGAAALRELEKERAIVAAQAQVDAAATAEANRDGLITDKERLEIARQVAEVGANALKRDFAEEEGRIADSAEGLRRYKEGLEGVGLARQLAAAGASAYYAEIDKGGSVVAAEIQRDVARQRVMADYGASLRDATIAMGLEVDAQTRAAAAAGTGEAASRQAAAATAIAAAASRSAAEASMERTRQAGLEAAAVTSISNEALGDLDRQIAANDRMTAALKEGGEAVTAAAREEYRLAMQRKLGAEAVDELTKVMLKYDQLITSQNKLDMAGEVGRQTAEWERQLDVLERRNELLAQKAGGGREGLAAGAKLSDFDVQERINDQVLAKERELTELKKKNNEIDVAGDTQRYKAGLERQASLEKEIKTQEMAASAADSLGNTLLRIGTGDMSSVVEGVGDFMGKFKDLQAQTGSAGEAFAQLGMQMLDSAEAGAALGNMLGDLFGRSEAQNKNAQIGSTVATTVGDFFGVPKGISSFVGNIIGGLFGPGKSDSTAGVEVYTRDDRIRNFDTSPSKQDSGNMSARDALADSVNQFTNLLEELTGGKLANAIAIEVGSRDGNRWRVYGVDGQLAQSGTTAVGDIEGTLSQVLAAITDTLTGVDQQLKDRLTGIDFSNLERAQADVDFVLNYATAIRALNGELEGGQDSVNGARQAVIDLGNYVQDFRDQAGRLGYDAAETASALRASVERFAGIREAAPVMTDIETKVAALAASFSVLGPVLESVGYSAEGAAAAVKTAQDRQMAGLRADVVGAQDRRYDDLIGNGYLNEIRDLISTRGTEARDAVAVGLTDAGAQRNFGAGLANVLGGDLRTDQIQEAIRLFGSIPGVTEAANKALADLAAGIGGTATVARSAADIAQERNGLETQLLQLQGDTVALRQRELAALDPANRALQEQLWTQQDAAAVTQERTGLEQQLLRVQGDTAALRQLELEALNPVNRAIQEQIWLQEDQAAATQAANAAAAINASLEDRLLAVQQRNDPDAAIQALLRRQNAEFDAAVAAGNTADQLQKLAQVLGVEMTAAVDDLAKQTQAMSDGLNTRLLRAQASNPLLEQAQRDSLEAQALQIERNQELAGAANDNVRAMLRAIYAADDLAKANQAVADASAEAAKNAQDAAAALERIQGLGGSIREWVNQARAGGVEGYLSPAEQLANATTQFNKQLGLARGNDEDALRGITGYAQRLIEAQQGYAGSGGDTQGLISRTLAALENLPAVKSYDQQQIDLLKGILDELDINGDGVVDALERAQGGIRDALGDLPAPATADQVAEAIRPFFNDLDTSMDGLLSPQEFKDGLVGLATDAVLDDWFDRLDTNDDGLLDQNELTTKATTDLGTGAGDGSLVAIGKLLFAGNTDRYNLINATNLGLITLGQIMGGVGVLVAAGNSILQTIAGKVGAPAGAQPTYDIPRISNDYQGGYDPARDAAYLARYSDVAAAIGNYANAYEHFNAWGRAEGRSYASGTDFHPGGAALVHAGEMLLPPDMAPRGMKVLTARETAELMRPVNVNVRGGGNDNAALREMAKEIRQLREAQMKIAQAQAGQQSAESREQVNATNRVAEAVTERRKTIG